LEKNSLQILSLSEGYMLAENIPNIKGSASKSSSHKGLRVLNRPSCFCRGLSKRTPALVEVTCHKIYWYSDAHGISTALENGELTAVELMESVMLDAREKNPMVGDAIVLLRDRTGVTGKGCSCR
jgi:hypothetical protein